ncbi:MAG: RecQ family ATP-dependent DNA helicase [Candidatus Poribacteria bacterium]|nr:RecQ family ATP-dependent DNA helicase [Candidatus Poribacteria bacterium]
MLESPPNTPEPSPAPEGTISEDAAIEGDELLASLTRHFGHSYFRENQREIIEAILKEENVLAAFPTGYGKSLCYQLPALTLPGLTVIVSPLISLMKDQVDGLKRHGVHDVALINSSLRLDEYQWEYGRLTRGEVKLLYIAPERLRSRRFLELLNSLTISLFVIDEAHCISQWGHDFRPAYLGLRDAIQALHPRTTALFTATATPEVREDIFNALGIDGSTCRRFSRSVQRANLKFSVYEAANDSKKYEYLEACLRNLEGNGIIYAGRRGETENIARRLRTRGYQADFYHAGLSAAERKGVQERFFNDGQDGVDLVVATNAFGMGIDKPNIRYVVHWTMTGTLEAYYQETGRAGRDGKPSHCVLLYCPEDRELHEWFVNEENVLNRRDLVKLLEILETLPAVGNFRMATGEELSWLSGFKDAKIRVGISYLEKLGYLRRRYNVPSRLNVRLSSSNNRVLHPADQSRRKLLQQLRRKSPIHFLEFCREFGLRPHRLMEQLIDFQNDGHLKYWGTEDLLLIELFKDSDLLAATSADELGFTDYKEHRYRQIDQIERYAREKGCRGRLVREYFGEPVEADYRCGSCDLCDPSIRLVENEPPQP